jgi:hypothetical protein
MSTYDAPNFLAPAIDEDDNANNKPTSRHVAAEHVLAPKSVLALKQQQQQRADHDVIASNQLFTILLPNSYYASSNSLGEEEQSAAKSGNTGATAAADHVAVDYDLELPRPMKSATVFDYHEVSLEDYDWDRIFGEAAAASAH